MNTTNPKLLIIDDDPQVGRAMGDYLRRQGFVVDVALGGEQGLRLACQNVPDLVLCDVNMPKMDGRSVVASLRKQLDFANVPIVYLSAIQELKTIRQCMNLGGDDFIVKPSDPEEICETIRSRLALRGQQQAGMNQRVRQAVRTALEIIDDLAAGGGWSQRSKTDSDEHLLGLEALKSPLPGEPLASALPLAADAPLLVSDQTRRDIVRLSEVKLISANGEYSMIYWGVDRKAMFRKSLLAWSRELPPALFVRVHRSAIIHLKHLDYVERSPAGRLAVRLKGLPNKYPVSQRARANFNRVLKAHVLLPSA